MSARNYFALGGLAASFLLVALGIASIVVGLKGRAEVRDTLAEESIVGPEDSRTPGQLVDTGSEGRAQAEIVRVHQLTASGGLT